MNAYTVSMTGDVSASGEQIWVRKRWKSLKDEASSWSLLVAWLHA